MNATKAILLCAAVAAGCAHPAKVDPKPADYRAFVESIREYALEPDGPDGLLHSKSATTEDWESHYKVVHADENYASYRCDDYSYTGGAHGNTVIHVGTIDRKTGRELVLDDIFPKDRQEALKEELRRKAAEALGSADKIQNEDRLLTNNFCLMDDGWHFVYSPYDIASFADGVVEVLVARMAPAAK